MASTLSTDTGKKTRHVLIQPSELFANAPGNKWILQIEAQTPNQNK
jgi:hypothetical protein